ncbi:MAG: hypothetical protein ACLFU9_07100 [Candidatus Bathyarchaeia archaeon]
MDEVQNLLGFRRFELFSFLKTLGKADHALLQFNFGDLTVEFSTDCEFLRDLHPSQEEEALLDERVENVILVSFELRKGNVEKSVTYRFTANELKVFARSKQLKIESFRGC